MYTVTFITAANKKQARAIAKALISKKLAACVNIIDKVESLFWWKGKVESAGEVLLMVKSRSEKLSKIIKTVKANHSYQVPEIISLPIKAGDAAYLRWINDSIG
ncbi:MAG: divalent-cation tolerance protein CutA [Candidatus Omnitrophica bacterium]|nr:divalent-cation tolerance protein CutA [Candidatus Omnitrophota bacterium]